MKVRSKVAITVAFIGVIGCAIAGWYWVNIQSPEARAKDAVRYKLKDPESALFADLHQGDNEYFWCGTVNSRNGFGGMSGPKHFMVELLPTSEFQNGIVTAEMSRISAEVDILLDVDAALRFLDKTDRCFPK